jgi:hypothetical protein
MIFDIGDKKRIYEMNSWQLTEQIFRGGADVAPRGSRLTVTLGLRVGPDCWRLNGLAGADRTAAGCCYF